MPPFRSRQRGQVTWETVVSISAAGLALVGYFVGSAKWSGDVEACVKTVEAATVRIETKVDQILLQRGQK